MMKKWLAVAVSVACMLLMPFMVQADFADEKKLWAFDGEDSYRSDDFGVAVAISGNIAIVGAEDDDDQAGSSGSAYVFVRNTDTNEWTFHQKLLPSTGYSAGYFGGSVAISGDTAIIGAYGVGRANGTAYVFVRDPSTEEWTEQQRLNPTYEVLNSTQSFGQNVSISGDTVIVGAYGDSTNGSYAGSAYVFVRDQSTQQWTLQQKLLAEDGGPNDFFGRGRSAVAIDGDLVIVGATGGPGDSSYSGVAYAFQRTNGLWSPYGKLMTSELSFNNWFGWSVSIHGTTAVVGAHGDSNGGSGGSAYVFERNASTNLWDQQALLKKAGSSDFGSSVSISGNALIVGNPVDVTNGTDFGSAYIYVLDSTSGTWVEQELLASDETTYRGLYGFSVSISGGTVIVGAPRAFGNFAATGAAYVYTVPPEPDIAVAGSVAFGDVTVQTSSDQTVTVNNLGTEDLIFGSIASTNPLDAPFSLQNDTCSGLTLLSGASCTFNISFSPTATGAALDSLDIPSNDPDENPVTVSVSGTGVVATVPDIIVSPLVQSFGSVTVGTTSEATVTVTSNGTDDLVLGTIAIADPTAPFSLLNDNCSGQTLTSSSNCTFNVSFAPVADGVFNGSLNIPSNDPDENLVTVSMSGTGVVATVPDITVSPLVQPFGGVTVGAASEATVTLVNNGNADLVVGDIATANPLAAPFSILNDTCSGSTLAPAASCTFIVNFAPDVGGEFNDSLDIPSNDPDEGTVVVNVSGAGMAVPVPDITVIDTTTVPNDLQIPFGNVTEGLTSSQTVTVINDGNADLVVGDIAASNPLETPFSLQNDTCSGLTLTPAASCTFDIICSPVITGVFVDSFDIPSNDPDEDLTTVSVSGTGLSAADNNPPDTPQLVFPANGQQNVPTTMTLQWRAVTDPDGDPVSYQVFICDDSDPFNNCESVLVTSLDHQGGTVGQTDNVFLAGINCGAGLLLFGIALVSRTGGRKRLVLLIAMVIIAGGLLAACSDSSNSNATAKTFAVSGLDSDTQYSWGVVADDGQGGQTQSAVWSFTTN